VLRKQKVYSAFSSAQLGFRNYAFLNLTARNDWSSTLPTGGNSYFYPSINASFVLTDAFDIKSNVLTYAKLRGGWAEVGKDTDPYQLINTYPFNQPFGSSPLTDRFGCFAELQSETGDHTIDGNRCGHCIVQKPGKIGCELL
jgi:hypothetical protein